MVSRVTNCFLHILSTACLVHHHHHLFIALHLIPCILSPSHPSTSPSPPSPLLHIHIIRQIGQKYKFFWGGGGGGGRGGYVPRLVFALSPDTSSPITICILDRILLQSNLLHEERSIEIHHLFGGLSWVNMIHFSIFGSLYIFQFKCKDSTIFCR